MAQLYTLSELGQSTWLNYLRRAFIDSGELRDALEAGVTGITSTPIIFEKAITDSSDYDQFLAELVGRGMPVMDIYQALVVDDIQRAADMLMPIFELTEGKDGYVTMELNPALASDSVGTIAEARHVLAMVNRPNVMIEIPATTAGIAAIETLTRDGVNINATHIFSLATYDLVAGAYVKGLESYISSHSVWRRTPASVASFSISRIDALVDEALLRLGRRDLLGQAAIALAKAVYLRFCQRFSDPIWQSLEKKGAKVQKPKWTRTTPRSFRYFDTYYIEALIGPDSICTLSPASLVAFRDHGRVASRLTEDIEQSLATLTTIEELGIDLDSVATELQNRSLADFDRYFQALIRSVSRKRGELEEAWRPMVVRPGRYGPELDRTLEEFCTDRTMCRIWSHDHTVWQSDEHEIVNRLGWLHIVGAMQEDLDHLSAFSRQVIEAGFERAVLLGMGGSSLAPELYARTFTPWVQLNRPEQPHLELSVLDTTDPDAIRALENDLTLERTLFIVASKSGRTVETISAFKYFYNRLAEIGREDPGRQFVAITDPGTLLVDLAERYGFREVFLNDPSIGGRYSALSYFGLVPAALIGLDLSLLLDRALGMTVNAHSCNCPLKGDNLAAQLGVFLGDMALDGRDKLTLITSPSVALFGDWVEQLIAESTGKQGRGILPVVNEPLATPAVYGDDRFFVHLRLAADDKNDRAIQALADAGHPVVILHLRDIYDLGGLFFTWEMATAVASHFLSVNPFNQPDVEAAKRLARQLMVESHQAGRLPPASPSLAFDDMSAGALESFLDQVRPGDYVAFQAYVPSRAGTEANLQALRVAVRDRYNVATTAGYGPRYLHSTGQFHKGGPANGLFVQLVSRSLSDMAIPAVAGQPETEGTFGTLKAAQAAADAQVLLDARRRIIRFWLTGDVESDLNRLLGDFESRPESDLLQPV
ncbi:MAG: bifunctional transaldolase/phosoglucose isomerase [Chloroflexota bacterium]|nr:MAG: bifunctional transaldolase/phosoglucose isomerase [Chloroflexota bacterium]